MAIPPPLAMMNTPMKQGMSTSAKRFWMCESVATTEQHTCALTTEARVRCWGEGTNGRTGYNDTTNLTSPGGDVAIETSSGVFANIIMVDTGGNHTCVLTNRGKVRCFGKKHQWSTGLRPYRHSRRWGY